MAASGRDRTRARETARAARTTTTPASAAADEKRKASLALAQMIAAAALDAKAEQLVVLDLNGVTDMTDYFVIASGTSDTHVRSIGDRVLETMKKAGQVANHVEGLQQGRWVLLDFVDVVVHVFHPTLRSFYQLERLWGDATEVPVTASASGAEGAR